MDHLLNAVSDALLSLPPLLERGGKRYLLPSWNVDEWLDGIGRGVAGV
jgi:hypothetical protein